MNKVSANVASPTIVRPVSKITALAVPSRMFGVFDRVECTTHPVLLKGFISPRECWRHRAYQASR